MILGGKFFGQFGQEKVSLEVVAALKSGGKEPERRVIRDIGNEAVIFRANYGEERQTSGLVGMTLEPTSE